MLHLSVMVACWDEKGNAVDGALWIQERIHVLTIAKADEIVKRIQGVIESEHL